MKDEVVKMAVKRVFIMIIVCFAFAICGYFGLAYANDSQIDKEQVYNSAVEISPRQVISGQMIMNTSDDKWYKLCTRGKGSLYMLNASLDTWYSSYDIEIYNDSLESCSKWMISESNYSMNIVNEMPSTWVYIHFSKGYSSDGSYSFSFDDLTGKSKTITAGSTVSSEYCAAGGEKWYKYKTSSDNSFYRINVKNGNGGVVNISKNIWESRKFDESLGSITSINDCSVSSYSTTTTKLSKQEKNKWYYVRIQAPKSAAKYSIKLETISDQGGDSLKESKSIGLNAVSGSLITHKVERSADATINKEDSDWFKFTVPRNGNYQFNAFRTREDSDSYYKNSYSAYVYNRDGDLIDTFSVRQLDFQDGAWTCVYSPMPNMKKGNIFYVCVHNGWNDPTPYKIRFDYIKKNNTMKASAKVVTIKYKKLKRKSQVIRRTRAVKVSNAKGTVTYKLVGVTKAKYKRYFKDASKTGKITVKKKLKKGTYKVKIKVRAAGNADYKAFSKTVTVKVRVK